MPDPDDVPDPQATAAALAAADRLIDQRLFLDARAAYRAILDRVPDHAEAVVSALFAEHLLQPTVLSRLAVQQCARRWPDVPRAAELATRVTPWRGFLPGPFESCVAAERQARPRLDELGGGTLTFQVTRIEGASAMGAVRRWLAAHDVGAVFEGPWPRPDLRKPAAKSRVAPFEWTGKVPRPAVGPPPAWVARRVEALADTPYSSVRWFAAWSAPGDADGLFAAALHPGAVVPERAYARVHAAAFGLAALPGWRGTRHRELLHAMAHTRNDWLAVGALAALSQRALVDDVVRAEAADWAHAILKDPPDDGYWCLSWPAAVALHQLRGDLDDELRYSLVRHLQGIEDPPPPAGVDTGGESV